jgi:cyanophycinase
MRALTDAGLVDAIRERFRQGATIGGTSAGAAVMSLIMLSAVGGTDGKTSTVEAPGLALWADVIVDQHFLIRNRSARLQEAVLRHPDKPGIGIDERTAVVVRGHFFEVIGVSKVVVMDARRASRAKPAAAGAAGVATTILQAGMRFDLQKGAIIPQVAEAHTTGAGDAGPSAPPRVSPSAGAQAH